MRFTIDKKAFVEGLGTVIGAIDSKPQFPVLSGLLLIVAQEGITLVGSNSDITIKTFIPSFNDKYILIEDVQEGSVVLQAKLLNNIIKKLPEQSVSITMDDKLRVVIKSGKSKFKLNGMDAQEYPKLPNIAKENMFKIEASLLKDIINKTVFAVSTTRPILTGVNVQKHGKQLKFVATDSHRLSQVIVDQDVPDDISITIPGNSLKELNKILPDIEIVKLSFFNNLIMFEFGTTLFISRILDGNFPDISRIIPDNEKTLVKVSNKELRSVLERASVLSDNPIVKLSIDRGIMAKISTNTPEVGNLSEEVILENLEGEEVTLSFSARYMLDALNAIAKKEESVIIGLNGDMRPFTLKREDDESMIQLVLPVRTS